MKSLNLHQANALSERRATIQSFLTFPTELLARGDQLFSARYPFASLFQESSHQAKPMTQSEAPLRP